MDALVNKDNLLKDQIVLTADNNTLLAGKIGESLFYFSQGDNEKGFSFLEQVLNSLDKNISASFGTGLTGAGMAMSILIDNEVIDYKELVPFFDFINQYLDKQCTIYIDEGYTDYLFGASGIIQYFLLNKRTDKAVINKHIQHLLNSSSINPLLGFESNRHFPHINFGIAHGISGTGLVLLNALADQRICDENRSSIIRSLSLIEKYVLRYIEENNEILFPIKVFKEDNEILRSEALSWSYGDLGTLLFLIKLAIYNQDTSKREAYTKLIIKTYKRIEDSYIPSEQNLGIRHGMAGHVLLLNEICSIVHDDYLESVKLLQIKTFSELTKNRELTERVFERDLGAKAILNELTNSSPVGISNMFIP